MTYYKDVMDRIQEYQPELVYDNNIREELYIRLHIEEVEERRQAEYNRDIVEAYDGICDMIWTAYGVNNIIGQKKTTSIIGNYGVISLLHRLLQGMSRRSKKIQSN